MSNEGAWIKVTNARTGRRVAVHLNNVMSVDENTPDEIYAGRKAIIEFVDGTSLFTAEDFDKIGEMIR